MTTMRECSPAGASPGAEAEIAVARAQHRFLSSSVGRFAKQAESWADVELVAAHTHVLRHHRPAAHDVLSVHDTITGSYVELGLLDEDGGYVGVGERLVLCEGHDDLVLWPCPEISGLTAGHLAAPQHRTRVAPDRERSASTAA